MSYFRSLVPGDAILDLVVKHQPATLDLLRAEILPTTASTFIFPRDGRAQPIGRTGRHHWSSSTWILHFSASTGTSCGTIVVLPPRSLSGQESLEHSGQWRRRRCSFKTRRSRSTGTDHPCELEADSFRGFGREFEAALREDEPDAAATSGVFAGLDRMRKVPRWTFNDPVVEADAAVAKEGRAEP